MSSPAPISIPCTCGATVQAPAQYAGRTYACQTCGQALKVPGLAPAPAQAKPGLFSARAPRAATLDDLLVELARIRRRADAFLFFFILLPLFFLIWAVVTMSSRH